MDTAQIWTAVSVAIESLLGAVLVVAGIGKLRTTLALRLTIIDLNLAPPWASRRIAAALPWAELLAGFGLLTGAAPAFTAVLAFTLFAAFAAVAAISVITGRRVLCNCFGPWSSGRLDGSAFVRNLLLLGLLLFALWADRVAQERSPVDTGTRLLTATLVVVAGALGVVYRRLRGLARFGRRFAQG